MIRLPSFHYLAPRTLAEATRMLAEAGPDAMPVSGGTDLYPNMKRKQVTPPVVVGLRAIREMKDVRKLPDGSLSIGAGVTLTHLAEHSLVHEFCPAIGEAALLIASPLLRNMGTLGGNLCLDTRCHFLNQSPFWREALGYCMKAEGDICRVAPGSPRCWAITSADLPPLLIALRATVRLVGANGERTLPLADLYRDDGILYLQRAPDEVLAEVTLPPLDGTRATYLKLRRRGTFDFPALGVAAALQLEPDGRCASASVVLGAVTSRPIVVAEAQMLVGSKVTDEIIAALASEITRQARPLHLADYTHSYRKQMVAVYVTRALKQLTSSQSSTKAHEETQPAQNAHDRGFGSRRVREKEGRTPMTNQQRGLTFDQLNLGDRFVSPRRTVTEAAVVAFAGLSGDFGAAHTDAEFAKTTPVGARTAHGTLVAAIGTGLGNQMGVLEGTTLALMEQVIRFTAPVRFGDTVHLELIVREKKETSKPDRGVVVFDAPVINQNGQTVVEMQWTLLMRRSG